MNKKRIIELSERFADFHIGVVGDLIFDRYIWGHATRISPEAPVPIVKVDRRTEALGGSANVLRNITTLGAQAVAFGVIGEDVDGDAMLRLCTERKINTDGVIRVSDRQTTVKTRLIADRQQIARIDEEKDSPIDGQTADLILDRISTAIRAGKLDAIVIEDYQKGVISLSLAEEIRSLASAAGIRVALDPHPGNSMVLTGLTLVTPNRSEAFALAGRYHSPSVDPVSDDEDLRKVGAALMDLWAPEYLLITLGKDGMVLFTSDSNFTHIATAAKDVFDVSGAGDTVIASFITSLLSGASASEAAEIANHAAGIVVGSVGTVPIEIDALIASFQ